MVEIASVIWADGPSSQPYQPSKEQIRAWGTWIEGIISAFTSNGGLIYTTKALLDADLARGPNSMAWVVGDPVVSNNGVYGKVGGIGFGYWVRRADLPYSFIIASNSGAGAPDTIQATTAIPVSGSTLILLPIAEDYSGEGATVSFNGGIGLPIKTNSGEDVRRLVAGSVVYGVISGVNFRLANDEAIATLIYEARDIAVDAADRAEDARDIAAGYASDAVSQGNVPIYGTVQGLSALAIPAGINAIRLNGYAAKDDNGGWYAVEVANSGTLMPWHRQSNGGTRRWMLLTAKPNPDMFGTGRSALEAARDYAVTFGVSMGGRGASYDVGTALPGFDFLGVKVDPDPGMTISGAVAIYGATPPIVSRELKINYSDSAGTAFTHTFTPSHQRPWAEKSLWVSEGDIDRTTYSAVDAINMLHRKVAWPAGDSWSAGTPTGDASQIDWAVAAAAEWRVSFTPVRGGDEINAVFGAGSYQRGVFIRTNLGYVAFYVNASDAAQYAIKNIGVAVSQTAVDWLGHSDHLSMKGSNSLWTIRIIDHKTFSVLLNGMEVIGKQSIGDGVIYDAGFGSYGDATVSVKIEQITRARRKVTTTPQPSRFLVVGDSISAGTQGDWPTMFREAMDGTLGLRVISVVNQAIAGYNSADALARLNSSGTQNCNYAVVFIGTNDVQGGNSAEVTLGNLGVVDGDAGLLSRLRANFCEPIVAIPPLWYPKALSGFGADTLNYEKGARTRAAIIRLCAIRGIKVIDLQQFVGPILSSYLTQPSMDRYVRDNIHGTPAMNRALAWAFARAASDLVFKKMTPEVKERLLPNLYQNSWTGPTAMFSVSEDEFVSLSGSFVAGTKTDGTVIYILPANLAPATTKVFYVPTDSTTATNVRIDVQADGNIVIRNAGAATSFVLHSIRWKLKTL